MSLTIITLIAVLIAAICVVITYNGFIKLRNHSDEALSTMDIYLKKRYDLIPNLVEVVKQYKIHERETLEGVVHARNMAMGSQALEERTKNENLLSGALKSLFALAEGYPDLKADGSFINLQNQLETIENDIAQARKYYNGVAKVMNNKVQMFPTNLFAKIFGFKRYPFFEADEAEKQPVPIKF